MLIFDLTEEELLKLDKTLLVRMLMAQSAFVATQDQAFQAGFSHIADAQIAMLETLRASRETFAEIHGAISGEALAALASDSTKN